MADYVNQMIATANLLTPAGLPIEADMESKFAVIA